MELKNQLRFPYPSSPPAAVAACRPGQRLRLFWLVGLTALIWMMAAGAVLGCQEVGNSVSRNESEPAAPASADNSAAEQGPEFDFFGNGSPRTIEQLRQMQEQFHQLADDVADATVNVQVGMSQGSGVIVTRDGYVMTAAHVIGGAGQNAIITLQDGTRLTGKTLGLNRTIDSGLLKITEDGKYPYLNPGESESLKTGQWVMAIGHPGGWDADRGLVFRIGRVLTANDNLIRTDCAVVGGDSGGPLVDMDGNVVGIHSRIGASLSSNVHVPVDVYSTQWDDLARGRDWGRGIGGENPANEPWIGISFDGNSLVIESVSKNGPADKAGLQVGDVIIEFNGSKPNSLRRFGFLVRATSPGETVTIKYRRDVEELETELTVASQAENR